MHVDVFFPLNKYTLTHREAFVSIAPPPLPTPGPSHLGPLTPAFYPDHLIYLPSPFPRENKKTKTPALPPPPLEKKIPTMRWCSHVVFA